MNLIAFFNVGPSILKKEASEEDLKYALLHGSRDLKQHMLDRGEKLTIGHTSNICYLEYLVNYVIS